MAPTPPARMQLCEFTPKKPNGPLSRRCLHCGEHQDNHGIPPPGSSTQQQESGLPQKSEEQEGVLVVGAEGKPKPEFQTLVDGTTGIEVVVLDTECCLVRNLLGMDEQADLLRYILDRDRSPCDKPKAMVSAPKTLRLGADEEPSLRFAPGQQSLVTGIIAKAIGILNRSQLGCTDNADLTSWVSMSMAAIQYESPDGYFHPHIDHSDSIVFLISLGCTANFMVKGPKMEAPCLFKFQSGDLLVFNASTEAAILHGVVSIDDERSNPITSLGDTFQALRNHRYGVQCRLCL